ncbi:hypothetical protein Tco_1408308 [Tanacetum coccineum]
MNSNGKQSDDELHSEGQDLPLTKLINAIDGNFKFRMEIPDIMINDAIKQSARYKYYKLKKDESEKGNQEVNVPSKPKKKVVPKKLRTLTVADNIVDQEIVAVEIPPYQKMISIVQPRTSHKKEKNKHTDKDDDEDNTKDFDMDIFEDETNIRDNDDAAGFGVFIYNKSQELPKFTPFSLVVTCSSMKDFSNLLNDPPVCELTDILSKPVYTDAHTTSAVANLEGNLEEMFPDDRSNRKVKAVEQDDPPNNREGETRKKRRKEADEPSLTSSKKNKAIVVPFQEDTLADQPKNKKKITFRNVLMQGGLIISRGSGEAAKKKTTWFDMLFKSDINQNEDHILGPSTIYVAKKLKEIIK